MSLDPNKSGNGDTGNSGNINEWGDMRNLSYTGNGKVEYKGGAYIEPREDFGDGDDFTLVDLDKSANTSDRDYGKALRDAMGVNNMSYNPDRSIQIADSGVSTQDVSKNHNYHAYFVSTPDNSAEEGGTKLQNEADDDANKFNPGDPNIAKGYEEDTGNAEKRGRVASIIEKARKSGIGKAFVRATIGVLLLGSLVGMGAKSGLLNKKAAQNATAIEQKAPDSQQESNSDSIDVTKALDDTAAAKNGENSEVDKLNNRVDIKLANGTVLEGVDFSLGGDNSGVDMVDKANMDSEHAGAFTHAYSDWINGGAAREYKSALGNEDAINALNLKAAERMNERMGNVGLLTKNYYKFADFDNLDLVNQENMGKNLINLMKDPAQYSMQRAIVEQKNKEFAEKTTQSLTVLERNKDNYCSEYVKLFDENGNETNDISRVYRAEYRTDESVNPVEGDALVMQFSDKETGLNYVESHPEVKEKWMRSCNLIKPGASDTEIQKAMSKWRYVGVLVVCGQDCWELNIVEQDSSTTYKAEYITPRSSSTSTSISITPELPGNPDPKLDDGSGTHKDEDNSSEKKIRRIYRGGNHHDDSSGIHESDKKKDDETPKETPKNNPGETPKETPGETPKETPGENPKDNEKVLEAKTENVVGGNEFDSQKAGTATDQSAAPLGAEATNNSMMESSGNQLSNVEVADQSVIGEFTENNASVSKEESENKGISTSVTNENRATNSSEAPADSFERQTVADEVVNESNGETAAQNSYDTSAAEANYDFYSAF